MALRHNPDYAQAWGGLGLACAHQDRQVEAVEHFRRALGIAPDNVAIRCLLADHLTRWQRVDEAVAEYRQALRVDPNCAAARRGLQLATGGDAPAGP